MNFKSKNQGFFSLLGLLIVAAIIFVIIYNHNNPNVGPDQVKKNKLRENAQAIEAARQAKGLIESDNVNQTFDLPE